MPKKLPRDPRLVSATARLDLDIRKQCYWSRLSAGISIGYRRNEGTGTWTVRSTGHPRWIKRIAFADDYEPAAPPLILTYDQACDEARALARPKSDAPSDDSRPATVAEALDAYEANLKVRGANKQNAQMPRNHLFPFLLAKPVALLKAKELEKWRDSLISAGRLQPSSINRVLGCLRAALTLAAKRDQRITNKNAWLEGASAMADVTVDRNVILDNLTVNKIVAGAYAYRGPTKKDPALQQADGRALGLLVETLAQTGTRAEQAARLTVADLVFDGKPRLMMPKSGKGGGNRLARKSERVPVPIPPMLARSLQLAAAGRSGRGSLLLRGNRESWGEQPSTYYRLAFRDVVASIGLDPDEVTMGALRHSAIVRQLLANVPIRVVASTTNTSVEKIEKHYSHYIAEHSDELSRAGLLPPEAPTGNIEPIA
jgi:integrase